jgi:hypothetical protein
MSEHVGSPGSNEPIGEIGPIDDVDMLLDEEMDENSKKDAGKNILYIAFAAICIGFFIWILLGLWGYMQEMSYGHG